MNFIPYYYLVTILLREIIMNNQLLTHNLNLLKNITKYQSDSITYIVVAIAN